MLKAVLSAVALALTTGAVVAVPDLLLGRSFVALRPVPAGLVVLRIVVFVADGVRRARRRERGDIDLDDLR